MCTCVSTVKSSADTQAYLFPGQHREARTWGSVLETRAGFVGMSSQLGEKGVGDSSPPGPPPLLRRLLPGVCWEARGVRLTSGFSRQMGLGSGDRTLGKTLGRGCWDQQSSRRVCVSGGMCCLHLPFQNRPAHLASTCSRGCGIQPGQVTSSLSHWPAISLTLWLVSGLTHALIG